jgi:hypothetical protein
MPHEISWYIENRVIGVRIYGEMDRDEPIDSSVLIDQFRMEGTPPIFLLLDFRDVTKFPTDVGYILPRMKERSMNQGEITWTIFLTDSKLFGFFGALASKVMNMPMRVCKTPEEVNFFIKHLAPDLEALLPVAAKETAQVGGN